MNDSFARRAGFVTEGQTLVTNGLEAGMIILRYECEFDCVFLGVTLRPDFANFAVLPGS